MHGDVMTFPSPAPTQSVPGDVIAELREHLPEVLRNRPVVLVREKGLFY